jgi:hypothetical protein
MIRFSELSRPLNYPEIGQRQAILKRRWLADDALLGFSVFKRSRDVRKRTQDTWALWRQPALSTESNGQFVDHGGPDNLSACIDGSKMAQAVALVILQ